MKIWLIKEGESALPIDESSIKLMRTGSLAKYLADQGHEVVWWTSGYIHGKKQYLFDSYQTVRMANGEIIRYLHSPIIYKRNISYNRIVYHRNLAKSFMRFADEEIKPDVIVCSYPTIQFARAALNFGRKHSIPVVLDIRDNWPDIFKRAFPNKLQFLAPFCLWPCKIQTGLVFKKAFCITGITPSIVEWGLHYAGRKQSALDVHNFIPCEVVHLSRSDHIEYKNFWSQYDVSEDTWNLCFFGTISAGSMDLETVILAIKLLEDRYKSIRLVVCGDGDDLERIKLLAGKCEHIVFTGWVGAKEMAYLMEISKCGLACYKNTEDMKNSFGNKLCQYMSGRLVIISSLQGDSKTYIERYGIGSIYQEGNVLDCAHTIENYILGQECEQVGNRAYQRFLVDFDSKVVNKKFEKYICSVVDAYHNRFGK